MATWAKKGRQSQREAQRRWRAKNNEGIESHNFDEKKPVLDRLTYWRQRRLASMIEQGIIIPVIEEESI